MNICVIENLTTVPRQTGISKRVTFRSLQRGRSYGAGDATTMLGMYT